jgi:hypothetical protein
MPRERSAAGDEVQQRLAGFLSGIPEFVDLFKALLRSCALGTASRALRCYRGMTVVGAGKRFPEGPPRPTLIDLNLWPRRPHGRGFFCGDRTA